MNRFALLLLLAPFLAGASCQRKATPLPPVPAQCDARCFEPCDYAVPKWNPPNPDSPEAFDYIPEQVIAPLQGKARTCDEIHRGACVQCLKRLDAAKVIQL